MSQSYTYSIANDTANGAFSDTLESEIIQAGLLIQLQSIQNNAQSPDDLVITFAGALGTQDKASLDSVVASHQGVASPGNQTVDINAPKDSEGRLFFRNGNVSIDEYLRVRHKGILEDTIASGQTKNIDWKIEQLQYNAVNKPSYMTGIKYGVSGGNFGDKVDFQIVDKDDILGYGPNTVLDQFGDNVFVFANEVSEMREHKADLITNLYIRAVYKNIGPNEAKFYCTLLRYMDTQ